MKPGSADHQSSEAKDLVVFDILRESKCADCGKELMAGDFLFMEGERPLCLTCADLDHLVYLPRGDTALTRRARKHSALSAVVVRFSRARKHYERQGVLVEESALEQAGAECWADAEQRSERRQRADIYRDKQDQEEHTSELQSPVHLVCRLLLEKKKNHNKSHLDSIQIEDKITLKHKI